MRVIGVLAECCLLGCLITGIAAAQSVAAEQQFPYTAYVGAADAQLRCGPGRNFYATHKLSPGQQVEVHRHGTSGWCAIRPPEDSFSWVRADVLRVDNEGIGIVLKDKTPCHVGSGLGDLWDVVQVKLNRGEEVEVLDAVLREPPGEGDEAIREMWCKIAPPSGEFRWIEISALDRDRPSPGTGRASGTLAASSDPLSETPLDPRSSILAPASAGGKGVRLTSAPIKTNGWKQSRHPLPREDDPPISRLAATHRHKDSDSYAEPRSDNSNGGNTKETVTIDADLPRARPEFQDEIEAIDFDLSQIVTAEPANWNFSSVQSRVEVALTKAQSALERGKVRLIQSRIAKFDDIRRRQVGAASTSSLLATTPRATRTASPAPAIAISAANSTAADAAKTPSVDASTKPISAAPAVSSSTLPGATDDATKFDGIGKLTKVVSQRPNAPKYALVNGTNEVVSFVTPAAGVNLQAFEGQYVGVTGQRGYMPELKKPHVTALRISPVESGGVLEIGRTDATRRR